MTNPDYDRSIAAVLCQSVYQTPGVLDYLQTSNTRFFQRGISKDGCQCVAKEIQRESEASNLLAQQSTIDENDHASITVDMTNYFPSIHKQPLFDLLA